MCVVVRPVPCSICSRQLNPLSRMIVCRPIADAFVVRQQTNLRLIAEQPHEGVEGDLATLVSGGRTSRVGVPANGRLTCAQKPAKSKGSGRRPCTRPHERAGT
jgi:hypothetical protein